MMLLDLPWLSRPSDHILEEHEPPRAGSVPCRRYRAQNSSLAPIRTDNAGAVLGQENLPTALTPFLLLQLHLL